MPTTLAGLDPARRQPDHNEVARSQIKPCAQLGDVGAFASHASKILQRLCKKRSHLLSRIGDADQGIALCRGSAASLVASSGL